jgi:hypothetical protein
MILSLCFSMIFSENRFPPFRIMLRGIASMKQNSKTTVNLTCASR